MGGIAAERPAIIVVDLALEQAPVESALGGGYEPLRRGFEVKGARGFGGMGQNAKARPRKAGLAFRAQLEELRDRLTVELRHEKSREQDPKVGVNRLRFRERRTRVRDDPIDSSARSR